MSLINDVLRDLDARRTEGSRTPGALDGIEPVLQPRSPARRRALLVSLAAMAVAGAIGAVMMLAPSFVAKPFLASSRPTTPAPVSAAPPSRVDATEAARAPLGQEELAKAEPMPEPVVSLAERASEGDVPAEVALAPVPAPEPAARIVRMERTLRPPTPSQQATALARRAAVLAQAGDVDAARQELAQALAIDPAHQAARLQLATLAFQAGASEEALVLLEAGQALVKNPRSFVELSARIHLAEGRIGTAIELLESESDEHAPTAEGRAMLAALYQRAGRHEQAATLYGEALRQQPENARLWLGLGISLEAQGRAFDARTAYLGAARLPGLDAASRSFAQSRIEGLAEIAE